MFHKLKIASYDVLANFSISFRSKRGEKLEEDLNIRVFVLH